ncbi:MAG: hypothetical protein M3Y28_07745 [Armatimonadota bacterium]|nr:hypothetical protein [Armatimonadota bacterium]
MFTLRSRRPLAALAALSLLLPLPLLTAGCGGGGGGGAAAPLGGNFAGHTYSANNLALGALLGSLQLTTSATSRTALGTLTTTPAAQSAARRAAAAQNLTGIPNCRGTFDPATGAIQLSGTFTEPGGAAHTFSISGTLPIPPATAGTLSITVDGVAYGPFTFGINNASGGTTPPPPTGGTTPPPPPTGGTTQTGLTISASTANDPNLQNGPFNGTASAAKTVAAFTLNGVPYDGQYNVDVNQSGSDISVEIFGLSVTKGQTFSATDPRLFGSAFGASGGYASDSGTVQVVDITDQSITLKLTDLHFAATPGGASGGFTVNGTFTAPFTKN